MVELVAIAVVTLIALRRSPSEVVQPAASLVLPAIEAPRPPHRLARGSVMQPPTPTSGDLVRRRPVLRPTHARR